MPNVRDSLQRLSGRKVWQANAIRITQLVFLLVVLLSVSFPSASYGVPAHPAGVELIQPDGTRVTVFLRGDEYFHWHEDGNGYPVVKLANSKTWVYARQVDGQWVPTDYPVGSVNPSNVGLMKPDLSRLATPAVLRRAEAAAGRSRHVTPSTGTMQNLVILVNFSDLTIQNTRQEFDNLFNQVGYQTDGAQGSVKDYYQEVSYGQLTVESTVVDPVTLTNGYAHYGGNDPMTGRDAAPREMVQEALAALEARGFDFRAVDGDNDGWVDGLTIIHAGGGEEYGGNNPDYIWSHQWSLQSIVSYDGVRIQEYHTEPARRGYDGFPSTQGITRIGVICHENGHFLGLPDLYDYDYDSRGVGRFCLMAGGGWGGDDGTSPVHMSAWCKAYLHWVTPTLLSPGGMYSVPAVEMNPTLYKFQWGSSSNEYILIENRQGWGFDTDLPGTIRGILIWHVDETRLWNGNNDDQDHYLVDLEEASGIQHLELDQNSGNDQDYYREGNATSFARTTSPNNLSYTRVPLGLDIIGISASGMLMSFNTGETVSPPTVPEGPAGERRNQTVSFVTGGATSNAGHDVEYRYRWGDGSTSDWDDASQDHIYPTDGAFSVKAQARCKAHPTALSEWSEPATIRIGAWPVTISIEPTGSATITKDPDAPDYVFGTLVTLTAKPAKGYEFVAWQGTDDDSVKTNTNTVTVDANNAVGVRFKPMPYTLTYGVAAGPGTLSLNPGGPVYDYGTVVTLTATPHEGYRVKAWHGTDDDTSVANINTVRIDQDRTVTVEFTEIIPKLTAAVDGGHGTVSVNPDLPNYAYGAIVQLTVKPDEGYRVAAWIGTDNDSSKVNTNTVTLRSDRNVIVKFTLITGSLPLNVVGGHGTLTANPARPIYDYGTLVNLVATPESGYRVKGWKGTDDDSSKENTNIVKITNADRSVTVEFEPILSALSTVIEGGPGVLRITPVKAIYGYGEEVTLTAIPDLGYRIKQWRGTGDDTSTYYRNTVTMTSDKTVKAVLERLAQPALPAPVILDVTVIGGHGSVEPLGGTFDVDTVVALEAKPDAGYRVKSWSGTDNDSSTSTTNSVTMDAGTTVTVTFEATAAPPQNPPPPGPPCTEGTLIVMACLGFGFLALGGGPRGRRRRS